MLVHYVLCCFLMWKSQSAYGQLIVSTNVIEVGGTFTVTCDASRAAVPTTATTVLSLTIEWSAGTAVPTTYARYRLFPSPYNSSFLPQTSPPRNWTFNFSGSQQGTSDTPNNRNTMKIEMVVYDAKCTDAGWYYCIATYSRPSGDQVSTVQYQNVKSITRTVNVPETLVLQYTMGPSQNGSVNSSELYATLTCTCTGPKELNFTWKYGFYNSTVNNFTSYPVQMDVSVAEPVLVSSGTTCVQYRHTSTLKFQTEEKYDGYMYVCLVTENNRDTVVGNMTIHTNKVVSGQSLVNPNVIEEGRSYTVTCDASRAAVPTSATTVVSLDIGWSSGTAVPTTFTIYKIIAPPPYNSTFLPQTSPARNWTFNFSGSQQGTSDTPNNRNTMKIEMVVYDARCTDAGLYYCNATYLNTVGDTISTSQFQNVTSTTRAVPMSLMLVPQYEEGLGPYESVNPTGSNVTFTCNVNGPKALTFSWKYGHSSSDVNSFTSYPVQNDVSVDEPVLISSGTTCVQYRHTSTLKFQTEDMYDGYMYVCVATENNEDTIVGNMTIYTKQVTQTSPPNGTATMGTMGTRGTMGTMETHETTPRSGGQSITAHIVADLVTLVFVFVLTPYRCHS